MKRKGLMVVMCVLLLSALAVGNAQAIWYNCTVNAAGTLGAAYFIRVTDLGQPNALPTPIPPAFTNRYFYLSTAQGNQKSMLAAALTAWASGSTLSVYLGSNISEWQTTSNVASGIAG